MAKENELEQLNLLITLLFFPISINLSSINYFLAPRTGRFLLRRGFHQRGCATDAGGRGVPGLGQPDAVQGILVHEPQLHRQRVGLGVGWVGPAVVYSNPDYTVKE